MLSLSRSRATEARRHTHFTPHYPSSLSELAAIVSTEIWSPVHFVGGVRSKLNFEKSHIVALDFDNDGLRATVALADVLAECRALGASFVVGTTKSHGVAKVSGGRALPAADRFRLIFIASEWCRDREQYEYNMRSAIEAWGADPSCKDGARFFWPCKEIVACERGGKFSWSTLPVGYMRDAERRARAREKAAVYREAGLLPRWLKNLVEGRIAVEIGERHKTCYKLGAQLALHGWSVDEIVESVLQTDLKHIGADDVRRAVENGWQGSVD